MLITVPTAGRRIAIHEWEFVFILTGVQHRKQSISAWRSWTERAWKAKRGWWGKEGERWHWLPTAFRPQMKRQYTLLFPTASEQHCLNARSEVTMELQTSRAPCVGNRDSVLVFPLPDASVFFLRISIVEPMADESGRRGRVVKKVILHPHHGTSMRPVASTCSKMPGQRLAN